MNPNRKTGVADGVRHFRKNPDILCQEIRRRYRFIHEQEKAGPASLMYGVLSVFRSRYVNWTA